MTLTYLTGLSGVLDQFRHLKAFFNLGTDRWQAARTVICLGDSVLTPVSVPSFLSTLNPNFQSPAPVRLQKPWGPLQGLCELPSGATATGWGRMQSTVLSVARTQPSTELPLPLTCSLATCGGPQTGKALWAPFIFLGRGAKLPPFAGESEFQKGSCSPSLRICGHSATS